MLDEMTERKWDKAARTFDFMSRFGPERRWGPVKQALFANMRGPRILFLAVGTGLDIAFFPPGKDIVGIDISAAMLEQAQPRAQAYDERGQGGHISLRHMDVHDMDFDDASFDQVFTSCTFCSVPNPVQGLEQLKRVLKPGGELYMFEHTGSAYYPFKPMMNLMTYLTRKIGPDMNRDTPANVAKAGFELRRVDNIYLDVVRTIYAVRPPA